jgi:50S ribosome-binding GTPase
MTTVPASAALVSIVGKLEHLAERRLALQPVSDGARGRATRLRDHLARHLRVRVRSLDAPLIVLLLGPTGAGKSTIFNSIAGRPLSATGVLRPTTRSVIVLASRDDRAALAEGPLSGLDPDQVRIVGDETATLGLAVVDAPDVDSVEHANRALADRLVEAADLCVFVTTAARYADRVPWEVLARVRARGLPLVVVVNRLPPGAADRAVVLDDVTRLFSEAGIGGAPDAVVSVVEGQLDEAGTSLEPAAIRSLTERVDRLRTDRDARVALAARALAGSLAGLAPLVDQIADDCAHEAIDAAALHRLAAESHERGLAALRESVARGSFLREEALRHWQEYVGADDVTRVFSRGIGAVRATIGGLFRRSTAPNDEVRDATTDDLLSIARRHSAEAARRTATAWADEPAVSAAVAADPTLWSTSAGFDERFRERLDEWISSIATDIAETGEGKRRLAKGASIGVNALGTGVMLATFIHTAGLTGAEVGIAAGTAFLNQKLLGALFGEAAMVELIGRARARLGSALVATFGEERERFDRLVPLPDALEALELDLRTVAGELRDLPPATPDPAEPALETGPPLRRPAG